MIVQTAVILFILFVPKSFGGRLDKKADKFCKAYGELGEGLMHKYGGEICGWYVCCSGRKNISRKSDQRPNIMKVARGGKSASISLFTGLADKWTEYHDVQGWDSPVDGASPDEHDGDSDSKPRRWPMELRTKFSVINPIGPMARSDATVDEVCESSRGSIQIHFFCNLPTWPYDVLLSTGSLGGGTCSAPLRHHFASVTMRRKSESRYVHVVLRKTLIFDEATEQPKFLQDALLNQITIRLLLSGKRKISSSYKSLDDSKISDVMAARCQTLAKVTCVAKSRRRPRVQEPPREVWQVSGGVDDAPVTTLDDLKKFAFVDRIDDEFLNKPEVIDLDITRGLMEELAEQEILERLALQ